MKYLVKHNAPCYNHVKMLGAKKDYETAFRAMHTLKGVAVNLGFTALYNVSSALTEKLRSQEYDNLDGLITDVKKQYDIVIEAIAALD